MSLERYHYTTLFGGIRGFCQYQRHNAGMLSKIGHVSLFPNVYQIINHSVPLGAPDLVQLDKRRYRSYHNIRS
jgi:hypothetical protein